MALPDNSFFQHKNAKVTTNALLWCFVMVIIIFIAASVSGYFSSSNIAKKGGQAVMAISLLSLVGMVIGAGFIEGDVHANELNEINKITDNTSRNNALKEFNAKLDKKYKDDTGWPWVGLF